MFSNDKKKRKEKEKNTCMCEPCYAAIQAFAAPSSLIKLQGHFLKGI